jgi:hypothetical protein
MNRDDLLALTPDALAALANRGLVKRAEKDPAPELDVDPDGTVRASFPDGVITTLAPGRPLHATDCSCTSTTMCRHIIGTVLAYQRTHHATATPFVRWSPGEFSDDDLAARFGNRVIAAARRVQRQGYVARVRRPSQVDPVPAVELPTCTVRFLVPGELGYVDTDAGATKRDEVTVLAVWAYREADTRDADAPDVHLELGGLARVADSFELADAVALAQEMLLDGVVNCGTSIAARLLQVRTALASQNLWWPVAAVDDLAEQLQWYGTRHAAYSPLTVASLLAELHARNRAAAAGGSLRSRVLGTEETAETPLSRVRLTGLGCRVSGTEDGDRSVDVFLADASAGTVLVLRKDWADAGAGDDLGRRRIAGARVNMLAVGNVVSESARRSASRMVRIASSRVARTTVTRSDDPWSDLPQNLIVRDFATGVALFDDLPPRIVRPRVAAEFVRVVAVGQVVSVGYHPGEQRLEADIADSRDDFAVISADYRSTSPAGLDSLAAVLSGEQGVPRFVSGTLHRSRGRLIIDPLAVAVDAGIVVPDLAGGDGSQALVLARAGETDPLTAALDEAAGVLADGAHLGLSHVPPSFGDRLEHAAQSLSRTGFRAMARAVEDAKTLEPDAWVAAQIRLLTTREAR